MTFFKDSSLPCFSSSKELGFLVMVIAFLNSLTNCLHSWSKRFMLSGLKFLYHHLVGPSKVREKEWRIYNFDSPCIIIISMNISMCNVGSVRPIYGGTWGILNFHGRTKSWISFKNGDFHENACSSCWWSFSFCVCNSLPSFEFFLPSPSCWPPVPMQIPLEFS